jgi:poly-gamma-glutamate synthase PgsB/CapB
MGRTDMTLLILLTAVYLAWLAVEAVCHERRLARLPLRIAVTGTRGKSGVVRRLAAVLRADGRRVFAKTTGSKARWILPDGTERDVPRRGLVSIIEQKRLVREAAAAGAEVLVAEVMSLQAENQQVETGRLLRPHLVLVTNARADHLEAMGPTDETAAEVLACGLPPGAEVFLPDEECRPLWDRVVTGQGGVLHVVPPDTYTGVVGGDALPPGALFGTNLDLVAAVARRLGVGEEALRTGVREANPDPGALRLWRWRTGGEERLLVSAFAANDPESTRRVLEALAAQIGRDVPPSGGVYGLLALRGDRVDRTGQWISALHAGGFSDLAGLFVLGPGAGIVARRVPSARVVPGDPERVLRLLAEATPAGSWIVGMGNIVGSGEGLIAAWEREAIRYAG